VAVVGAASGHRQRRAGAVLQGVLPGDGEGAVRVGGRAGEAQGLRQDGCRPAAVPLAGHAERADRRPARPEAQGQAERRDGGGLRGLHPAEVPPGPGDEEVGVKQVRRNHGIRCVHA
jgi:hypothetical protein